MYLGVGRSCSDLFVVPAGRSCPDRLVRAGEEEDLSALLYMGCLDSAMNGCRDVHRVNFVLKGGKQLRTEDDSLYFNFILFAAIYSRNMPSTCEGRAHLKVGERKCVSFALGPQFHCNNKDAFFSPPKL